MISVAVPSKGRLRDGAWALLKQAGYSRTGTKELTFVDMRPRDAAQWLKTGRVDAIFGSTDIGLESGIDKLPTLDLGFARSDLVVACRTDAPFVAPADLAGATIATHLPNWTQRWFADQGIEVEVVGMGGSLESVCAEKYADAIVDLRATGRSLREYGLHAIHDAVACQATFTWTESNSPLLVEMVSRFEGVLAARGKTYVRLHLPADKVKDLQRVVTGMKAPTVMPLAGPDDQVAVHLVVAEADFWDLQNELKQLGASDLVTSTPSAIIP